MSGYYLIIPAVIILIFMCPILLQAKATLNVEDMSGVVSVFIFRKKIIYFFYKIEGKKIILTNEDNAKEEEFDFSSEEVVLYQEMIKQIRDKARLKEIYLFYNIGLQDAFASAMLCGLINTVATIFFTKIKNEKPTASFGVYDTVSYNKRVLELSFMTKVSISLFDIVYSFASSVILSRKKAKNNI